MLGILYGLIASAINVVNTGVYQRTIMVASSFGAGPAYRMFLMGSFSLPFIALAAVLGADFSPLVRDPLLLAAVLSVSVAGIVSGGVSQYAYANEKIGVLAPFGEMGRILTVIAGFALFSNTSLIAFGAALLAGIAVMGASVDFKNFSVNRYCGAMAASGLLRAYVAVCSGWVLARLEAVPFTLADVAFASAVTFFFARREGIPKIPRSGYLQMGKVFLLNDALWLIAYLISLFLLKELGVVVASLLGMIAMVATVAYGRFVLGERPDGKTWALASFVAACVVAGSAF
jgi:drug/metabolite transporter (DMT)-like permease